MNADWSATSGIAQILNQPTSLSQFTNDLTTTAGDWTVQGLATADAGVNIPGTQIISLGSDAFKQQDAEKIGYQSFSPALDIVGAGEDGDIRLVKIWDDLTVGGNITADNDVSCFCRQRLCEVSGCAKLSMYTIFHCPGRYYSRE